MGHGLPLIAALVCATPAYPETREIRFAAGATSATVRDSVLRGERQLWSFAAQAGQRAEAKITALEQNAVFQIWRPGVGVDVGPPVDIQGEALKGAGELDDARQWSGRLPTSGTYLIVVGPSRGNASYELTLTIRR